MAKKKTIIELRKMVAAGEKIVYLTGYDYLTAKYEERAGIDMILVGDSLGNVILGHDSTFPVTMEDMIMHCKAVRKGAPNTFVVGDMPFMSYQLSDEEAVANAGRFVKEAGMDCVKPAPFWWRAFPPSLARPLPSRPIFPFWASAPVLTPTASC